MKIKLDIYINLIRDYLNNKISARHFEYMYLKLFKEEIEEMTDQEYTILNNIFFIIDDSIA